MNDEVKCFACKNADSKVYYTIPRQAPDDEIDIYCEDCAARHFRVNVKTDWSDYDFKGVEFDNERNSSM